MKKCTKSRKVDFLEMSKLKERQAGLFPKTTAQFSKRSGCMRGGQLRLPSRCSHDLSKMRLWCVAGSRNIKT